MKPGKRWLKQIAPSDDPSEWVPVVVEIPRGSRTKYALDKASGQLAAHRALARGIDYPTSYGFVPRTLGSDGMELDMMILSGEPLLPLVIARVRVIAGCTITAAGAAPEDKLLGAMIEDPSVAGLHELGDVPGEVRDRIERFYRTYKQDQGVDVRFDGWLDRDDALARLDAAFQAGRRHRR